MAWFKKKPDPIADRSRALTAEIAQIEAEIRKLESNLAENPPPKLRSTARPHAETVPHHAPAPEPNAVHEPIFEPVDQNRLQAQGQTEDTKEHYNDLGLRKYDLPALFARIRNHLRGPSTTNPKLVNYLAAGGLQGLRPLRYEKRVARNRFILFAVFLFVMIFGVWAYWWRHR